MGALSFRGPTNTFGAAGPQHIAAKLRIISRIIFSFLRRPFSDILGLLRRILASFRESIIQQNAEAQRGELANWPDCNSRNLLRLGNL